MTTIHVDHAKPSAAKEIIHEWMNNIAGTLINYDVAGHMALKNYLLEVAWRIFIAL